MSHKEEDDYRENSSFNCSNDQPQQQGADSLTRTKKRIETFTGRPEDAPFVSSEVISISHADIESCSSFLHSDVEEAKARRAVSASAFKERYAR